MRKTVIGVEILAVCLLGFTVKSSRPEVGG
jgi:hypothetical protein